MGETIAWERWEGTIESTFMAPVPRLTHLLGMCAATLVRALGFSVAILAAVALFVPVDLSHANVASALVLLATGAVAFIGLAIGSAGLSPPLGPEGPAVGVHLSGRRALVSGRF